MNKFFAVLLCAALPVCAWAAGKKKEKKAIEWKGAFCSVTEPTTSVVKTMEDWDGLWTMIGKPAPEADFKKFFAVAVFLGTEPTGGFSVSWEAAANTVRYKVKKPEGMVIQSLTQPYAVKLFPKVNGEIKVVAEGS